jgi:hypothetical protein
MPLAQYRELVSRYNGGRIGRVTTPRRTGATFATSALAESRRAELRQAMRRGEAFEIASGQPESEGARRRPTRQRLSSR